MTAAIRCVLLFHGCCVRVSAGDAKQTIICTRHQRDSGLTRCYSRRYNKGRPLLVELKTCTGTVNVNHSKSEISCNYLYMQEQSQQNAIRAPRDVSDQGQERLTALYYAVYQGFCAYRGAARLRRLRAARLPSLAVQRVGEGHR